MIAALLLLLVGLEELPAIAWELEVKACGPTETGGVLCRTLLRRNMGSDSACEAAKAKLIAEVPGTPAAWYGFPDAPSVDVRASCTIRRGAELHA
jgi:hypothetical protein